MSPAPQNRQPVGIPVGGQKRHLAYVEPSANAADSKWSSMPQPESYALSNATRRVLLGVNPTGVLPSKRAVTKLGELRDEYAQRVSGDSNVLVREPNGRIRWWTWAGARANVVLVTGLLEMAPSRGTSPGPTTTGRSDCAVTLPLLLYLGH